MTATEELRKMLNERGVEYTTGDGEHVKETCWPYMGELIAAFAEYNDGTTRFACDTWCFTPRQAIAATLGAGTCHNTQFAEMDEKADKKHRRAIASVLYGGFFPEDEPAEFTCSACGKTALIDWDTLYDIRFCPFCGRKVVKQ